MKSKFLLVAFGPHRGINARKNLVVLHYHAGLESTPEESKIQRQKGSAHNHVFRTKATTSAPGLLLGFLPLLTDLKGLKG